MPKRDVRQENRLVRHGGEDISPGEKQRQSSSLACGQPCAKQAEEINRREQRGGQVGERSREGGMEGGRD